MTTINGDLKVSGTNKTLKDLASSGGDFLPLTGGTLTGDLRLKGGSNYGRKINLGDGDYVYIAEPEDDVLELKGGKIRLSASNSITANGIEIPSIVEYNTSSNGYIRFSNGIQIAWQSKNVTAGGTEWNTSTKIWYSDHSMSNWAKPFVTSYVNFANVGAGQYWCTVYGSTTTNPGTIRCYRPNSATSSCWLHVFAIGTWK